MKTNQPTDQMKYQTPKLIEGGMHATRSTYIAPSTGHTILIIRTRQIGKSAHNDYTPNHKEVKDKDGKLVFIPRKIKVTAGSIAKYLFEQAKTQVIVETPLDQLVNAARYILGSLYEQDIKPAGITALHNALLNFPKK